LRKSRLRSGLVVQEHTPSQLLAAALLRRPLAEYIHEKRTGRPRWSWDLIATQLADDTGGKVRVTGQTLRNWYGEMERAAS
jgi:hypothetical protein